MNKIALLFLFFLFCSQPLKGNNILQWICLGSFGGAISIEYFASKSIRNILRTNKNNTLKILFSSSSTSLERRAAFLRGAQLVLGGTCILTGIVGLYKAHIK